MNTNSNHISRRDFVKTTAATSAAIGLFSILPAKAARLPEIQSLKMALIGCGGRGTGAARDCLEAAKALSLDVKVSMLADVFQDRLDRSRKSLAELGVKVPDESCVLGFDAYKKVMASDVDLVLLCTPPNFRPVHMEAAIQAGKHVFMEKPVAVDPVGCRRVMQVGEVARKKLLSVVAGTQRRHEPGYLAVADAIQRGKIGRVLGGTIHFCLSGGSIGMKPEATPDWEWMIRAWGGWMEMSGDHIVEQHVHSIDVANWFIGTHPVSCTSFGGRARRKGGNQYDFFTTDYEYPGNVHINSMCRQVNGCWSRIGQFFQGDKGIADITGLVAADRVFLGKAGGDNKLVLPKARKRTSYVQEHMDLLASIVTGTPINESRAIAESTLTAIMGRISAYTGQQVTWEEMMDSKFACCPSAEDFEKGSVKIPAQEAPVPGQG